MAARTPEVKLAIRAVELLSPSFSPAAFVAYLCRADMWVKEKFLEICLAFIDRNAEVWYEQQFPEEHTQFYSDAARMSEAFNVFRYN